ncbi:MAG TPA: divergent polysaccharide deacetylase family protein [Caulobacteraceae bacterium]|jgi:hypothetical protein
MFARRPLFPSPEPALAGAGGFAFQPLDKPYLTAGGAGVLLLLSAVALIAVAGDPQAGAPTVRVKLGGPASAAGAMRAALPGGALAPAAMATPDAVITTFDGGALPPAPMAGLFQPTPGGPLPVIAADGRTPAQAYARPFNDSGKPKVALVIGGLGLNAKATRQAIEELPADVTLSFVPYAEGLQAWIDLARSHGHEVLLEAPMEPVDYPQNDPGPYTLMAADAPAVTGKRLEWLLSRATGYFGVTNYLGGRFLQSDAAVTGFVAALSQRGLAFIDDGSASGRGSGVPRASALKIIDSELEGPAIGGQLQALEDAARAKGTALGSGFAYPVTLEQVKAWAGGLSAKGVQLAPASAVTAR